MTDKIIETSHLLLLFLSVLFLLIPVSPAFAGDVTLAWDANAELDLAGYKLYYGSASRSYGTTLDLGNVTTFTVTGLPSGTYFFSVTAYNTSNAESSYSNEVSQMVSGSTSDTTSPTLSFTSPISAAIYSTTAISLNIAGVAYDDTGVTQVTWANNRGGSGTATGTTTWSVTGVALLSGSNVITVTARDAAGNSAIATLTVTCTPPDGTAPTIAFTSPVSAATYSTTSISLNIAGTASDNVGVTQVTWANNRGGSGTATGTTTWSVTGVALLSGPNVITVTARDAAGNSAIATLTVTCTPPDGTAPTIAFTSPVSAATYSTTSISLKIAGTASDNVGVTRVTWANNRGGSGTATGTTTWSATGVPLLSGSNVITVTGRDAAGNSAIATLTVTCTPPDAIAPRVAFTSPVSAATYSTTTTSLKIAGMASDNVGVTQVSWANDRGGSGATTGTTTWSVPGVTLLNGSNVITVTARDAAGNTSVATLTVTCTLPDGTAPTVAFAMPLSSATYSTGVTPLNIAGTASDNVGLTQVTWANDRGGAGTAIGSTNWSVSGISLWGGSNIITVTARDAAGNAGSASLTVTYTPPDTTPPTISAVRAVPATAMATISWTTNEAADSQVEYGPTANRGNSTDLSGFLVTSHSQTLTGLTVDTQYHFRVKSRDAAGALSVSQDLTFKTLSLHRNRSLFYPALSVPQSNQGGAGTEEYTAVAVSSFDSSPATLTFTAFDRNGTEIQGENITNPVMKDLNPGEQMPAIDFQLFGTGLPDSVPLGQIRVDSTTDRLVGFFLTFDGTLSTMDGAEISSSLLTSIALSEIGDQQSTNIMLSNPNPEPALATIDLVRSDGTIRATVQKNIGRDGSLYENLYSEIFPNAVYDASDYLRIASDKGLLAYSSFQKKTRDSAVVEGIDATAGSAILYSPQYVVGGRYRTTLSIVNLDPIGGTVTLRLMTDDATQFGDTQVLPIAPGGKIYVSDQAFFSDTLRGRLENLTQGYVQVTSNGVHLAGSVVFGDVNSTTFIAALPLVSTFYHSVVFSHVASNETYFTGLAMMNPNDTDVVATIDLYSPDQTLVGTTVKAISARQRISLLLTDLFPIISGQDWHAGYFRVTVDKDVACFALFGTKDLKVLSAIPAQPVP